MQASYDFLPRQFLAFRVSRAFVALVSPTLGLIILASCGPPSAAGNTSGAKETATVGVPAALPAGTRDPSLSLTVIPAPTEIPGLQRTVEARATASPYPTAGLSTLQSGQPSVATVRRGALLLQVRSPKDTFLAGEGGQVEVAVRNEGAENLFFFEPGLSLRDERGQPAAPYQGPMVGDWPGFSPPPYSRLLAPGQTVTTTQVFQLPAWEQAAGHAFSLYAKVQFSRESPVAGRPDNVTLSIEAPPLPLRVSAPRPEQYLKANLQAGPASYRLAVTGADGQPPAGPHWGVLYVNSPNKSSVGALKDNASATWTGSWQDFQYAPGSPVNIQAWVAAPGYVTVAVTQTLLLKP